MDGVLGSRMNATFLWSLGSGKTTTACYATRGTRWFPWRGLLCLGATMTGGRSRACSGDPRVGLELVDLTHRKITGGEGWCTRARGREWTWFRPRGLTILAGNEEERRRTAELRRRNSSAWGHDSEGKQRENEEDLEGYL